MYRSNVDVVLTLNALQRRCVAAAGIDPARIHDLPHFVEAQEPRASRARGHHVLYVGRLVPEKGVDVLIRAAARAGAEVRVLGGGRDLDELAKLAAEVGADVRFVGSVAPAVVREEMARARALVVPSVWHEVLPLVVFEAFAARLPVIGSAVGGVADLLAEGRGVLVPPGDVVALADSLRAALRSPDVLDRAAAAAAAHAATALTRERFRARLLAAYDAALASRARVSR
jgi:glycosyltransferase involved in cell wall biosynthesis